MLEFANEMAVVIVAELLSAAELKVSDFVMGAVSNFLDIVDMELAAAIRETAGSHRAFGAHSVSALIADSILFDDALRAKRPPIAAVHALTLNAR